MNKIILMLLLINILIIFCFGISVYAENTKYFYDGQWREYKVDPTYLEINGENIVSDVPPIIFNDFSVVPVRTVIEKIGGDISWDGEKSVVKIIFQDKQINFKIDDEIAFVNGKECQMDIPAKIINDRMMIPTRFIGEALGMIVDWVPEKRIITIDSIPTKTKSININNIIYDNGSDNSFRISIISDGEIKDYSSFELDNHPRLVLDINDSILLVDDNDIDLDNKDVYCLRKSQFQIMPNITRVVVDMESWLEYKINLSEDNRELYIDFNINNEPIVTEIIDLQQKIIDTAKKYIGVKYVWAGESPEGFDCSGFVKYVYDIFDVSLPHKANLQADSGKKVEFDELKPADVLFFDTNGGKDYINHVGIYIGEELFIHASSSNSNGQSVVISDLNGFYQDSYMCAKRYLSY